MNNQNNAEQSNLIINNTAIPQTEISGRKESNRSHTINYVSNLNVNASDKT